jgi:hypothetical protein
VGDEDRHPKLKGGLVPNTKRGTASGGEDGTLEPKGLDGVEPEPKVSGLEAKGPAEFWELFMDVNGGGKVDTGTRGTRGAGEAGEAGVFSFPRASTSLKAVL